MVSQELLEVNERLRKRKKLHEDAVKFGNFILKLGGAIIFLSFIYIFVPSSFNLPQLGSVFVGGIFLGFLMLIIGRKIIDRKTLLAPFSIEEQEFLNTIDSLEGIETFQKQGIEFSRIEAAERLSKFEKQLTEPKFEGDLWENLTNEANENMRLLKRNIEERLIPSITQSENKEDIQKAYSIIEKFAKYLLNPTVLKLKELNDSMLELEPKIEKPTSIKNFFGDYPYLRLPSIIASFVLCSFLLSYLFLKVLHISNDTAVLVGVGIFAALSTYMNILGKK